MGGEGADTRVEAGVTGASRSAPASTRVRRAAPVLIL